MERGNTILITAWNNGKFLPNGAGYGIQVSEQFRDEFLSVLWPSFFLCLEGEEGEVELAINDDMFWSRGRELRSAQIGRWLIKNGKAPWQGQPPEIYLKPLGQRRFKATLK